MTLIIVTGLGRQACAPRRIEAQVKISIIEAQIRYSDYEQK